MLCYVYLVFAHDGRTPYYVGKGAGRRWTVRFADHPRIKVAVDLSEAEAFIVERALIAAYGRLDLGTGPLVNRTSGGQGTGGRTHDDVAREKMRKPRSDAFRETCRQRQIGRVYSDETKAKVTAALKERDPASRLEAASKTRGRKRSVEFCAQNGLHHLGKPKSPEHAAKLRSYRLGRPNGAAVNAKISASMKGKPKSEETRRRMSEAAKRRYANAR